MQYYGFFDGGEEYGQTEFNRYFDNIYESGIAADDDGTMGYAMTIGDGAVSVGTGFAILRGFYHYSDSAVSLSLAAPTNLPVIYRIIIQLDSANGITKLVARAGTESASPEPPALTRETTVYELSLGQFRVTTAGAISLVRDERSLTSVCGLIRPKQLSEYDTYMQAQQARFEEWYTAKVAEFTAMMDNEETIIDEWLRNLEGTVQRNIFIQKTEPSEAVSGTVWLQITE